MAEIFLSYAKEDKAEVEKIYLALVENGLHPWMDDPPAPYSGLGIPVGELWDTFLRNKLNSAELILLFLSEKSVSKQGYVQREYKLALNKVMNQPPNKIVLIPILLEDISVPDIRVDTISLHDIQWHNLRKIGITPLIESLKKRLLGTELKPTDSLIRQLKNEILDLELKMASMAKYYDNQVGKLQDQRNELNSILIEELTRNHREGKLYPSH